MNRFLQLDVNKKGRDFVIGDIHGKYNLLMAGLARVKFNFDKDRLIAVGDLIDRGIENMQCLDLMWEPWFFTVMGNHELMMATAVDDDATASEYQHWTFNGGHWYYALDEEEINKLKNVYAPHIIEEMPLAIEVMAENGKRVGITHTDTPKQWPWWEVRKHLQNLKDIDNVANHLLWSRTKIGRPEWKQEVYGVDMMVHGHTPTEERVWRGNAVYIDHGARTDKLQPINIIELLEEMK